MTSLIIETTKEGEKKQKSIPYINPNASNNELLAFAQGLVDLTNQTYESTTRLDKISLEEQQDLTTTFLYNSITYPGTQAEPVLVPLSTVNSNREFSVNFGLNPSPNQIFIIRPTFNNGSYSGNIALAQINIYGGYSGGNIRLRLPVVETGNFSFIFTANFENYSSISREVFVQVTEG